MEEQRQSDQLELIYSSSVPIQDVFLKTCRKQWTIETGGEIGSWITLLILMVIRFQENNNYSWKTIIIIINLC